MSDGRLGRYTQSCWTVTRSSLRMLRPVAAFCRPLQPVLLLVSFPRSRRPVVGVLGLCRMWHGVLFARQRRPVVGILSPPRPLCDIPSGYCPVTGPWTVTRSSLRVHRRVAAFWRPLRPVFLPVCPLPPALPGPAEAA